VTMIRVPNIAKQAWATSHQTIIPYSNKLYECYRATY